VVESDAPFASLSVECWEVFFLLGKNWFLTSLYDLSGMVHDPFWMVKRNPFKWLSDLQRPVIKRSGIESPGLVFYNHTADTPCIYLADMHVFSLNYPNVGKYTMH